jgi:hypothetical protein
MEAVARGVVNRMTCSARDLGDLADDADENDIIARINMLSDELAANDNNALFINYRLGKAIILYRLVSGATWDAIDDADNKVFHWYIVYLVVYPDVYFLGGLPNSRKPKRLRSFLTITLVFWSPLCLIPNCIRI